MDYLLVIRKYLKTKIPYDFEDWEDQFSTILQIISRVINQRLLVVIDEANQLMDLHHNQFHALRKPDELRPLFTLVIGVIVDLPQTALVVAGTKISLRDVNYWDSLVAKKGAGAPMHPEVICDLPVANHNSAKKLLSRLFNPEYVGEAYSILIKYIKLPVRFRIITTWVENYIPNFEFLEQSIIKYLDDLFTSTENWSLYSVVNSFACLYPNNSNILFELILSQLLYNGIVPSDVAKSVEGGLCRVIKKDNSHTYSIDEVKLI